MKKSIWIGFLLVLSVAIGIALIDAGAKRPINWTKTYNFRDKIPYGLFVFRNEVPHILGADRVYADFGETIYELVDRLDSVKGYETALLDVYQQVSYSDSDAKKILDFVDRGGEVFIASTYIGKQLLDTLGIKAESLQYKLFVPTDKNVSYSLGQDTARLHLDRINDFNVFSKLNARTCTILGQLHARGRAIPNFIRVSHGEGSLYLHLLPEVFTNYHLLQQDGYEYVARALEQIKSKKILFSDYYFKSGESATPLRVILTSPGFNQAWYLLLFGLFVLLVFKSKREQRAVKIVRPEPNLSKEFAKTIGTLYYENGDPGNIVHKKIDYFLYAIRHSYHLETMDLLDRKFLRQLSLKSAVNLEETTALFSFLHRCREQHSFSIEDVRDVNRKIEEFKSKANLI
ncbi:DUF4350 domain-containing protein [Sphingobacterium paucimobilis]|uniref:DUF4350 domain-containing protein n=1 Tax=Sphingobacterium paucimobilis HER1398 TaxID=1346330 RepID=U2J941_9SPHI|nr:DUF4350 domain-containing protein [Sphingobacterium paucimobilis]ERJ61449.1 hypothetical protein M472_22080 [Sphingobacterium paucimobilis HER1398]